ncbi:MAG: NAD(P)/FAD-dependent oxidoreductase [Planctomycetes bacterium]|nr:NAD(P)/FAD-dependent oxidoreductase [Planctomycetota bacterium]
MMTRAISPTQQVADWLARLDAALDRKDAPAAADLFDSECYWRDLLSFTWNIKTLEGKEDIRAMVAATIAGVQPCHWQITGEASEEDGVTSGWFTFETAVARGKGYVRLKGQRCWTLLTTLTELKGHEEQCGATRVPGVEHGVVRNRQTWLERKNREDAELGYVTQPYCVIVGGGQGGIALAARLKRLRVPTLIIEKNKRPGDSWRNRYKSLCLHDPVWYDHLPYLPFPDHWPVFSPKDKIADWLEMYARVMELNYWHSTECRGAQYHEDSQDWSVTVIRDGKTVVLRPRQLVLATGMSGMPNVPRFPGADTFRGEQFHSSQFRGLDDYRGKKCILLGANNSAHDICAALWEQDADVTMIQRSSTHVARSASLMELGLGRLYSEAALKAGITTEIADLLFASIPYRIMHTFDIPVYQEIARRDADLYEGLSRAGFLLDFGDDGSGLFMKYLRRGSGYYIDVGASELIADGRIKLHSGVNIERILDHAVELTDGAILPADLIIYATGYGSMNGWAARLISQEVADRVGKCWGLGSATTKDPGPWEGELRNMWKPTQQPALWFHGGNLHQSRHYSLYLALQIKARQEGIPTPVYGIGQAHHRA